MLSSVRDVTDLMMAVAVGPGALDPLGVVHRINEELLDFALINLLLSLQRRDKLIRSTSYFSWYHIEQG